MTKMTIKEKRDLEFYRTQEGIRWIHMSDHDNEYYQRLLDKERREKMVNDHKWNGAQA